MTCYSLPSLIANRRREFEPYREHHSSREGRDCEIESGGPVVGGYKHNRDETNTKEHGTTDTQNISGREEKNRSSAASTLGKNQGSKEGVVRYVEISGRGEPHTPARIRAAENADEYGVGGHGDSVLGGRVRTSLISLSGAI